MKNVGADAFVSFFIPVLNADFKEISFFKSRLAQTKSRIVAICTLPSDNIKKNSQPGSVRLFPLFGLQDAALCHHIPTLSLGRTS
jgi:hypothetical protein